MNGFSRPKTFVRLALWAASVAAAAPVPAYASAVQTFSVFNATGLQRKVHGQERQVDLSAGPLQLGDAAAFFGVDSLSDDLQHYLTSGVRWHSLARGGRPVLALDALHTTSRGQMYGSQTLMRARASMKLADYGFLPSLTLEADRVTGTGTGSISAGQAARLGLAGGLGADGKYHLEYFRTGAHYAPWGSSLVAGDSGFALATQYRLGRNWRWNNRVSIHHGQVITGLGDGLVDRWRLSGARSALPNGQPWQFDAQIGDAVSATATDIADGLPLALAITPASHAFGQWQVDSGIGWYQGAVATPDAVPVAGGMWRVSASHSLQIGRFHTRLRPSFAIGGSRYQGEALGSRTGLALGFPGLLDNVDLNVDYLSAGWGPVASTGDMRLTLDISKNAASVLPSLQSMLGRP